MSEPTTPLMRQYHAIKKQHPQTLVLFRLGDFYELFYEDAIVASRELQITLTSRNRERGQRVPMCGVPYHAAETYIARLIRAGYKVAICEQMEEASKGKKLVRRDVVRVITPGTATEAHILEPRENNFLAALARDPAGQTVGLACVDVSTGEFRTTEFSGPDAQANLRDELEVLRPREILLPRPETLFSAAVPAELNGAGGIETRLDEWVFREDYAERILSEQFGVVTLEGFGLAGHPFALAAAGALVHYLRETSARRLCPDSIGGRDVGPDVLHRGGAGGLEHLDRIRFYEQQDALVLDNVSVRNLELIAPLFADPGAPRGESAPTLLSTLDETSTGMGARLLRSWMLRPSITRVEIAARLDAVAELKAHTVAREEIRKELAGVFDLERLTSRVTLGTAGPRDLLALRQSLAHVPLLRGFLSSATSPRLVELHAALDPDSTGLAAIRDRIEKSIADEPPALISDPGIIRRGYHAELDDLRTLSQKSKQIIAAMEERERKRTGIASLKIRYNQVFGYYIEISKPNLHLAPADYERKQTLVNAERFTAPELKEYERKVLDADERILEIERRLFTELRAWIAGQAAALRQAAGGVAQLDVLVNFARIAAARNYTRPEFTGDGEMLIVAGRHPVIQKLLEDRGDRFVPNDLFLNDSTHLILLITGPNMGGKSTYLRQAALIVLMAQMGSFVPAAQAKLPITDRIFTRIGASDNLARGRSTFLVEMTEVATILNTATKHSLVLLDEVGRGTATFDGLSIAWAVVEHMVAHTRARALFATHYHELTELEELLPEVKNVHVSVKEVGSEIVFLKRVEPGSADKSYGIEVARLAGLPRSVIERAREVLIRHEVSEHQLSEELSPGGAPPHQDAIFAAIDREVLDALRDADLDNMKPLDALNLLAKLKKQIS
ncbi:MAG: DNA mismatch repair protein MutS [Acidobacteria bacterium]|nr:DNA mismatch repair protein MutS [Acidobacteriota bacterium]